jgi:GNAT superfamily N-acetyltransferase
MTVSQSRNLLSISLCQLAAPADIQAAQRLRYDVWQSEGVAIHHPERAIIADGHDDHATHWGVFDGDSLVGAARLCLHSDLREAPDGEMFINRGLRSPVASMNRLVVLRSHRGLGIGSQLDEVRIQKAKKWDVPTIITTPVNVAARRQALEKHGFHFLEGAIGHPIWSPTVCTCAYYLTLRSLEAPYD